MNKNYFLIGTFIGILFACVIGYLIMGSNFHGMLKMDSKYNGVLPILCGVVSAIVAGIYFDRKKVTTPFLKSALILPATIFVFGSLIGCLANFIINGQLQDFFSWFVKPIYWLVVVGLPSSLIIGSTYFLFTKKFLRP